MARFFGRHPATGQPLNKKGAVPNLIHIWFLVSNPPRLIFGPKLPLYSNDGAPVWRQHGDLGQEIDVALIPFAKKFSAQINSEVFETVQHCVNEQNSPHALYHKVGGEVFVVGYPLGIAVQKVLPIWKRGSIASEPGVPIDELPLFLIDTATREGMSGSPVYARQHGFLHYENGESAVCTGPATTFLGVYSGRHGADDEFSAQVGRVWHRSAIDKIIADGVPGSYVIKP